MDNENITKLKANVCAIYDKQSMDKIDIINFDITKEKNKYSNTNIPIFKIYLNGKLLSRNNPYKIEYKCLICNRTNIINSELFQRKINKNIIRCYYCKEQDEVKRLIQSEYMKTNNRKKKEENNNIIQYDRLSNVELIKLSNDQFNDMDDEFKFEYYKKHLTHDEYDNIKNKIISINNGKIKILENYQYIPIIRIHNQTLFNPRLYNKLEDKIEKIEYIEFKCDLCNTLFIHRDLFIQKNRIKVLCKYCSLCNNTFKKRKTNNYIKEPIIYQSQLELKFIRFCNDNKIIINNGPKLDYIWNDTNRKYLVDFYLPELNILIEIKDDHIWHKLEVNNGVFKQKLEAINSVIGDGTYKDFMLIFSKNLVKDTQKILKMFNKI